MAKCPRCGSRKAKRECPALGLWICPVCCGEGRRVTIECPPDCVWLEGASYQYERRRERASAKGKELVELLNHLFKTADEFGFAMMVLADIHVFDRERRRVSDEEILGALEAVKRRLSPLYIPGGEGDELAAYLHGRLTSSPRYERHASLSLQRRGRVLDKLVRAVRNWPRGDGRGFAAAVTSFIGEMDLREDFHFTGEDLDAVTGERSCEGPRRTDTGLILP